MKGSEQHRIWHRIWSRMNAPFLIPAAVCTHDLCGVSQYLIGSANRGFWHSSVVGALLQNPSLGEAEDVYSTWQKYDFNQAGCLLCGTMHICFDGLCPVQKSEEGYDICTITAMCVKSVSFSRDEYMDTVAMFSCETDSVRVNLPDETCGGHFDVPDASSELCTSDFKRRRKGIQTTHSVQGPVEHGVGVSMGQPSHRARTGASAVREVNDTGDVTGPAHGKNGDAYKSGCGAKCVKSMSEGVKQTCQRTVCSGASERHPVYSGVCTAELHKSSSNRCIVNKKNRYRSWVYHKVMHHHSHHASISVHLNERKKEAGIVGNAPVVMPSGCHAGGGGWQSRHTGTDNDVIRSLIQGVVSDVLCSSKWRTSMEMEVCQPHAMFSMLEQNQHVHCVHESGCCAHYRTKKITSRRSLCSSRRSRD